MHLPVNHPSRHLYRVLTILVGATLIVFGVVTFAGGGHDALGLRSGPLLGVLSLAAGAITVLAAVVGGPFNHFLSFWLGGAMAVFGLLGMAVIRTDLNAKFDLTVLTCGGWMVFGMVIFTAGLYGKTGSSAEQYRVDADRHQANGVPPTEGDLLVDRADAEHAH